MTKRLLSPPQLLTLEIMQDLWFGRIERLVIRDGHPRFEPPPRIVEEVKLGSDSDRPPREIGAELTLPKELDELFTRLTRFGNGIVDIEVRHGRPFRLIMDRSQEGFLS